MPEVIPLEKLNEAAFKVLVRELGIVNAIRYIQLHSPGHGNYTEERDALLGNHTVEELAAEIYRKRENPAASGE